MPKRLQNYLIDDVLAANINQLALKEGISANQYVAKMFKEQIERELEKQELKEITWKQWQKMSPRKKPVRSSLK